MGPSFKETSAVPATLVRRDANTRPSERILIAYFVYVGALATIRSIAAPLQWIAWILPASLWAVAYAESRYAQRWSSIARDWVAMPLVLVGYWQIDWFTTEPLHRWHEAWIKWDRILLDQMGLRAAIESAGWLLPSVLEFCYLALYAIPPLCLAALYVSRRRVRVDQFLMTFFLGTFCAYALLPHFPSLPPRLAYPGADLPHYSGFFRVINVWLLDHLDIGTAVFPSGHVAAAFSASFGLLRALPERRGLCWGAFGASTLVFLATVYGRYHWAADGIASICICILAWRLTEMLERHD